LTDKFDIVFSGNVAFEGFYDSRQLDDYVHGEIATFPLPVVFDKRCLDIHDKDSQNFLGVRAFGRADITGPKVWNANTSVVLRADFVGLDNGTVRAFKLLRGFLTLDWKKTSLRMGHSVHPMCLREAQPGMLSYGEGVLFNPFLYSSQIKVRHRAGDFEVVGAISKNLFSESSRWAVMPDLFLQMNVHVKGHIVGAGMYYHSEVPRLKTDKGFKTTNEQVSSIYPFIFGTFKSKHFECKLRCIYSENAYNYNILGAYGVRCRDPYTDERIYVNIRTLSLWTDLMYRGKKVEPGIFIGFSKNLGASEPIIKSYINEHGCEISLLNVKGALTNVKYMFTCCPRFRWRFGCFTVGVELEHTRSSFARRYDEEGWQNDFDDFGSVICSKTVSNTRLLCATSYAF